MFPFSLRQCDDGPQKKTIEKTPNEVRVVVVPRPRAVDIEMNGELQPA
jgi:hypothetical protein